MCSAYGADRKQCTKLAAPHGQPGGRGGEFPGGRLCLTSAKQVYTAPFPGFVWWVCECVCVCVWGGGLGVCVGVCV